MINDNRKIEIAKHFIEVHATAVAAWSSDRDPMSDDDHYINVYENLFMGVYGDCYGVNAEYDEEGELIVEATDYEVEVVQFDSVSGRSEFFTFDLMGEQTEVASFIEEYGRKGDW
jgi:hypothetical protein